MGCFSASDDLSRHGVRDALVNASPDTPNLSLCNRHAARPNYSKVTTGSHKERESGNPASLNRHTIEQEFSKNLRTELSVCREG